MMHTLRRLLAVAVFAAFCNSAFAISTTILFVNCIPGSTPPSSAECFKVTAGKPFTAYVIADDANRQIDPTYRGSVHFTSNDPAATLPPDHTFTAADAGIFTFQFTFNTPPNPVPADGRIIVTDAANSLSGSGGFLVYPAAVLTTAVPALSFASLSVLVLALFVTGHRILKHQA